MSRKVTMGDVLRLRELLQGCPSGATHAALVIHFPEPVIEWAVATCMVKAEAQTISGFRVVRYSVPEGR